MNNKENRVIKCEMSLLIKYPHILLLAKQMNEHKPRLPWVSDDRYNFARAVVLLLMMMFHLGLSEVLTNQWRN